jgi:hypothetical protein
LRPIDRGGALKALETPGSSHWVHRIKRVRKACPDLLGDNGWRWRVLRTSNAHAFTDSSPAADPPNSFKSEKPTETPNQGFISSLMAVFGATGPPVQGGKRLCEAKGSSWLGKNRTLAGNCNLATAAALIVRRSSSTRSLAIWALMGFFEGLIGRRRWTPPR